MKDIRNLIEDHGLPAIADLRSKLLDVGHFEVNDDTGARKFVIEVKEVENIKKNMNLKRYDIRKTLSQVLANDKISDIKITDLAGKEAEQAVARMKLNTEMKKLLKIFASEKVAERDQSVTDQLREVVVEEILVNVALTTGTKNWEQLSVKDAWNK